MAIWIARNWQWLEKTWQKAKGQPIAGTTTISQSCISRFLATFDAAQLGAMMSEAERAAFFQDWKANVRKLKRKRGKPSRKRKPRIRRHLFVPAKKTLPQFSFDGKSRSGCNSDLTGRAEIDLVLYSPDTNQVLATRLLDDKEGERSGTVDILKNEMSELPPGLVTGDAGITSPTVVSEIKGSGNSYILGIKGNAGKVFEHIEDYDWEGLPDRDLFYNEGHGREEIRSIKRVPVATFPTDIFSKYQDVAVVFQVINDIHHVALDKYTTEMRYFIGDSFAASLSPHEAMTYIRDHWLHECYHWVKDVVLNEDDCPQKGKSASRTMGHLRAMVVKIGMATTGSVRKFIDHFSADPQGTVKHGIDKT